MANLAVVSALTDRHGSVYEDRLNHASLIDAARLARSHVTRYPHADVARLKDLLSQESSAQLITTDGVFSMDGDIAPIPALLGLAKESGARLIVDDAHGIGVLGANGRGSFEHHGETVQPPAILVGTLGKAFGTFGAFIAGEADLIEVLIQFARPYIYTTALPPAVAEATRTSLAIIRTEAWRRDRLRSLVSRFRRGAASLGFELMASETPIQPLLLGSSERALVVSQQLRAAGLLVPAIRPPTVAEGSARLRVTFSSAHEEKHIDRLLAALAEVQ